MRRCTVVLAIIAAIAGCDGEEHSASPTGKGCPGTRPSRTPPFPGEDFNYGNRYIGAALWQRGRLVASRGGTTWGQILPDGSIWAKVGWGARCRGG